LNVSSPAVAAVVPEVHSAAPAPRNRLGRRWFNTAKALLGLPWQRRLGWAALQVPKVRHWEKQYDRLSDADLRATGMRLRGRARGGESLDRLLPEAFGLSCVATKRITGLLPFDVQLAAGVVLHQQSIAEVATGEGKTLIGIFPVYLAALEGKGAHVVTVNDYLARRDAEWLGPVFRALGLTVGVLQQQMLEQERFPAYRCDITYGTGCEFGFDFLRDRLKAAGSRTQEAPFWAAWNPGAVGPNATEIFVQRGHHFALVDEADSIFIDEARTPLIIANPTRLATPDEQVVYIWADRVARQMVMEEHFTWDNQKHKMELTTAGKQIARWSNPPCGPYDHAMDKLEENLEQALQAHHRFRRDQHYMVDKGKVIIIDEYTGRSMPDRHWQKGLHQAVEAKEGAPINFASEHAAQITYQTFFKLYKRLAGMTGTAAQNRWELRRVYKRWVVCVPTNRPCIRDDMPPHVYPTEDAKFDAVVQKVKELQEAGRAVLIGTRSVDKSEKLSERLKKANVPHQVLSARHHASEAKVIEGAGLLGRVTIATNMAGRGTDIKPAPEVIAAGGLHVLGTEWHDSRRIDRQLAGRAGRQGDPGSSQFFLSLEDELLENLGEWRQERLKEIGQRGGNRDWDSYLRLFKKAQRKITRRHHRNRVDLMVHEKNRQEILKDIGADPYVD
jgi:preprotein translocase subunit SecA